MNYKKISSFDAVSFHNSHFSKITGLVEPLLNFLVKQIIYIELVPGENIAFFLSNTQGIVEKFLDLGKFSKDFYFTLEQTKTDNYCNAFIWPPKSTDPVATMLQTMGLTEGFTIIQKTKNLIKTWAFANNGDDNSLINLFVNNPNIFYHFIKYFDMRIKNDLFPQKDSFFTSFKTPSNNGSVKNDCELKHKIAFFKQNITIGRHYLYENRDVYITNKELECLFELSKGKTYKEISKTLGISAKTVRYHIDAVKLKTNINCKHLLINAVYQKNIFAHLCL